MKRRSLALILAAALLLGAGALAANVGSFTDVDSGAWYADAVKYVTEEGLFNGKTDTLFAPGDTMTRGMFVTVLGRYADVDPDIWIEGEITASGVNVRSTASTEGSVVAVLTTGDTVYVLGYTNGWYQIRTKDGQDGYVRNDLMQWKSSFSDLGLQQYYTPYVHWAYSKGITSGIEDKIFGPENSITREQICTLFYNYVEKSGLTLQRTVSRETFPDDAQISSWAKDAVYAMQEAGIIGGRDNGNMDPKANATRCEVAVMFQRFAKALEPEETPTPSPSPSVPSEPIDYDLFGNVVEESAAVNDAWFADACFIGHSIIEGLQVNDYFPQADFYCHSGISCKTLLTYDEFAYLDDGEEQTGTITQALAANSYEKVYIMLGINEMSSSTSDFVAAMTTLVNIIKTTQDSPDIYLIAVTPVGGDSFNTGNYAIANILKFNDALQQLSLDADCYYLDLFGRFADETGRALDEYMNDSFHFNAAGNAAIETYIKTHTVA